MTARTEARNVLFLVGAALSVMFAVGAGPGPRGMMFTAMAALLLREVRWKDWRNGN
jgi:hypothetical protein